MNTRTLFEISTHGDVEYRRLQPDERIEKGDLHSLNDGQRMFRILNESTIGDVPANFVHDRSFWRKMEQDPVETFPLGGEDFVKECDKLLLEVNAYDSDISRLGYRLFRAVEKLKLVIDHAERQFIDGKNAAEFNRLFINNLKKENRLI